MYPEALNVTCYIFNISDGWVIYCPTLGIVCPKFWAFTAHGYFLPKRAIFALTHIAIWVGDLLPKIFPQFYFLCFTRLYIILCDRGHIDKTNSY